MKQPFPKLKFSLLALFLMTLAASIPLAYYARQSTAIRNHHIAIDRVQLMGGRAALMTPSGRVTKLPSESVATEVSGGNESFAEITMGRTSQMLAGVDFTDPSLTEQEVREMVTELQRIILSPKNEEFGGVFIDVQGNGIFTPELVMEIREKLPGFSFIETTPFPNATTHSIKVGMTAGQVSQHVAQRMYDERTDWVGDQATILRNLASIRHEYKNPDGSITWTYATDDLGVGTIAIDFDDRSRVSAVSFSRGTPRHLRGKRIKQQPHDGMRMN